MFNKDLRPIKTTLFLNKLDALLERLQVQYRDGTFSTQEEVVAEFSKSLDSFYDTASKPFLQLRPAKIGTSPSYEKYNSEFQETNWDLLILFKELETLEKIILGNFNYMVSERDKLNTFVKRVNSKVGDYILYLEDPVGKATYMKDSFNDTSKIDFGSELLSKEQCEINQNEGIITLPVIRSGAPTTRAMKIRVGKNSNGTAGNYQQIDAVPHDDLRDILDSNPDTWYEYERVQQTPGENSSSLVLDLVFYFDKPDIINFIRINPNNFGTQTAIKIESIDTSLDGKVWVSVKDDIPISGFLQEDEEDVFTLASSTSKYAGQGLYTFTPRKIKYIHIVLSQSTPYQIQTPAGLKWRYAIGIRDVEAHALQYKSAGDIISLPFSTSFEIQKVSVLASENPTEKSDLADIVHQVSPDDGARWFDIQPQDRDSVDTPEILSFNTGQPDSITTEGPVYSIRHRMLLNRNSDAFVAGSSMFSREVRDTFEVFGLPVVSPIELKLNRPPVAGTVKIMNPFWGSRALGGTKIISQTEDRYEVRHPNIHIVGLSTGQPNQVFNLPISEEIISGKIQVRKGPSEDDTSNIEFVLWIDNDSGWEAVGTFSGDAKQYQIDNEGKLVFGNDTDGRIPLAGSYIGFTLKEERLALSASSPYAVDLVFSSDGDKENVKIYRYDSGSQYENINFVLKAGARVHRLPYKNISETSPNVNVGPTFSTQWVEGNNVSFIDGNSELSTGEYSIDYENGVIYTWNPAGSGITVTYDYTPRVELSVADWDYILDADRRYNRIQIYDTGYADILIEDQLLVSGSDAYSVDLGKKSIVPSSVSFVLDSPFDNTDSIIQEVKYINGVSEFQIEGGDVEIDGYYSVDYANGILYSNPENPFDSDGENKVGFRYTSFSCCYNIARFLDADKYTVDTTNRKISISEKEALKVWGERDASVRRDSLLKIIYDYVHTTRESIEELEPYLTPIVRDFVMKVLPKE